jgi:hypothetical protein
MVGPPGGWGRDTGERMTHPVPRRPARALLHTSLSIVLLTGCAALADPPAARAPHRYPKEAYETPPPRKAAYVAECQRLGGRILVLHGGRRGTGADPHSRILRQGLRSRAGREADRDDHGRWSAGGGDQGARRLRGASPDSRGGGCRCPDHRRPGARAGAALPYVVSQAVPRARAAAHVCLAAAWGPSGDLPAPCVETLLDGAGLPGAGSQPWLGRSGLFSPGYPTARCPTPPWPVGVILRRAKPRMPALDAFLAALTDFWRSLKEVEEALRGRRARPGLQREHPLEQGRARQAQRLVSGGRGRVPERPRLATSATGKKSRRAPKMEANGSLRSAGSRSESEAIQMNHWGPCALQARVLPSDLRAACAAHFHSRPGKRWAPRSGWRGEPSRVDRS